MHLFAWYTREPLPPFSKITTIGTTTCLTSTLTVSFIEHEWFSEVTPSGTGWCQISSRYGDLKFLRKFEDQLRIKKIFCSSGTDLEKSLLDLCWIHWYIKKLNYFSELILELFWAALDTSYLHCFQRWALICVQDYVATILKPIK